MKIASLLISILALIIGIGLGAWYASNRADEQYGELLTEELYIQSASDIKTFVKLLELTHEDEKDRVIKYMEALLNGAEVTLIATSDNVPTEVKVKKGKEAIEYLNQYRAKNPKGIQQQ